MSVLPAPSMRPSSRVSTYSQGSSASLLSQPLSRQPPVSFTLSSVYNGSTSSLESQAPLPPPLPEGSARQQDAGTGSEQQRSIAVAVTTYALHIFLIALHIVLLIVFRLHLEKHIMIHLSDHWIGKTSTAMTIAATLFATVYATALVWLTQRLAFRRLLSHGKSLTAIHDEYNSWIGLGSAFITLWGQRTRRSALRWVVYTTIYLGGIDILHVSIPAMFTLQVGTAHHNSTVVGELAYSDVRELLYTRDAVKNTDAQNILGDASSLLPYIALQGSEISVGLDSATIYDRLPVNIGAFNTTVNSTTFDVECGLLYSPKVDEDHTDLGSDEVEYYDVSHGLPNAIVQNHVRLMYLSHNNTAVLAHQHAYGGERSVGNRSFYLYGTFDIEDSAGNLVPTLELPQGAGPASNVSMVGCDLFARNNTIMVNTTSRLPLPGEIPDLRDGAPWSMWEPQALPDPQALDMLDLWSTTFKMQYSTSLSLAGTTDSSPSKYIYLGFMESFVISTLGLDISGSQGKAVRQSQPRGRVQLFHVENALSRLAAAYYWSLSRIASDSNKNKNIIPIAIPVPVRQLQLNGYPIAVGLAASVLLLWMSHLLVRQRLNTKGESREDIPKSLGLLQFLWFVLNVRADDGKFVQDATSSEESNLRGLGLPYGQKGSLQGPPPPPVNTRSSCADSCVVVTPWRQKWSPAASFASRMSRRTSWSSNSSSNTRVYDPPTTV